MTTHPLSNPAGMNQGMRPAAAAAPAAAPGIALDPFKLLNRYKYLLAGAAIVGMVLGVGAFLVMRKVNPVWTSTVLFQCYTPSKDPTDPVGANTGEQATELERFMATEARQMVGEVVLQRVANDPRLAREAPVFAGRFTEAGGLNQNDVIKELDRKANARIIAMTRLIELSFSDTRPDEATTIVRLIKEAYQVNLQQIARRSNKEQADLLTDQISKLQSSIRETQARRDNIMKTSGLGSMDNQRLVLLQNAIIQTTQQLDDVSTELTSMDREAGNPGGPRYDDRIRNEVETDPVILGIKQDITGLESAMDAFVKEKTREHREYKAMEAQLTAKRVALDAAREEQLLIKFQAMRQALASRQAGMRVQLDSLNKERSQMSSQLEENARSQATVEDLEQQLRNMQDTLRAREDDLSRVNMVGQLPTSMRVVVAQNEQLPREMSSPKPMLIVPGVMMMIVGLTAGVVLIIELLDQRVKGPSDVAMLPRTRVLGWIPDATEDPAGPGAIETAFRERPRGAIAETFRNLRGAIVKRMELAGHRSLLIVSGMPGSGATSLISNLALAAAASELRVLIIDANIRRPGMHRVFGLAGDARGLGDVLMGTATLDESLQRVGGADGVADPRRPAITILTAGTKDSRRVELLSTDAMQTLLDAAEKAFDLVLIDVAPAIVASDGMTLANRADASVLVVRALAEKRGMVARLRNDLSEAKGEFLGVVVNGVKGAAGGYLRGNIKATHDYANEVA